MNAAPADPPGQPQPGSVPPPPQPEKPPAQPQPTPAPVSPEVPDVSPLPPGPEKAPDPVGDPVPFGDTDPEPDGDEARPEPGVIQAAADSATDVDDSDEERGPVRRCALSRTEMSVGAMIRFVAAPDGSLLPDATHKLPGRGVWIEGTRAAIEQAAKRGVFAKSLKRNVSVPADLADRVERLLERRLLDSLALANKAGVVVTGAAKIGAALEKGEIVALMHGIGAGRDGVEKLDRKFKSSRWIGPDTPDLADVIVHELSIDEISLAIGRSNVVHAALRSGGATVRLLENARRLGRFRVTRVPSF